MQNLGEALREIVRQNQPSVMEKTIGDYNEWLADKAERENMVDGHLYGIECKKCRNRGYIYAVVDGELRMRECECVSARKSLEQIERSGLKLLLDEYTFEKYKATEDWQKHALSLAQNYLEYGDNMWLFFGGQSGSGKSHLCTAVCGELLNRNNSVKYMMWKDEATKLKSLVTDTYEYERRIDELKSVKVLYIDDFLKVQRGQQPTPADILLAFEILNYRYVNKLRTILSSEKTVDDILSLDDALGGRIYEMSKGYQMNIGRDKNKNFRLRK